MASIKKTITYFEKPGKANTEETLKLAYEKAQELGISKVVIASTRGETAKLAVETMPDLDLVFVTHSEGFREPDQQEFDPEIRKEVEGKGARVLTAQHAFGGVNRAIRQSLGGIEPDEIIANTLRRFGQGMKVVFEIALMAADAGLVKCSQPAVVVAGTGRGADLGVVMYPANAQRFFDLKMVEVFCMPAPGHPGFS